MSDAWQGDWQSRVRALVQELGHEDAFDFVMSNPGKSFGQLFRYLREAAGEAQVQLAFVQLPELFYVDADRRGQLRSALMESLVRSLQQYLGRGWNVGKRVRERRIEARTEWPIPANGYDRWQKVQDEVWRELVSKAPPDDWCPNGREDPILQEVFSRAWPEV